MNKFKVGDKVRVKSFKTYPVHWVIEMRRMSGKAVIIEMVKRNVELPYRITSCIWSWIETDFEEMIDFKLLDDKLFKI